MSERVSDALMVALRARVAARCEDAVADIYRMRREERIWLWAGRASFCVNVTLTVFLLWRAFG